MKTIVVLFFVLFLFLVSTSCNPEPLMDDETKQFEQLTVDPPSEVPDEEEELDPDN